MTFSKNWSPELTQEMEEHVDMTSSDAIVALTHIKTYGEIISSPINLTIAESAEEVHLRGMFLDRESHLLLYMVEFKACYLLMDKYYLEEQETTAKEVAANISAITLSFLERDFADGGDTLVADVQHDTNSDINDAPFYLGAELGPWPLNAFTSDWRRVERED